MHGVLHLGGEADEAGRMGVCDPGRRDESNGLPFPAVPCCCSPKLNAVHWQPHTPNHPLVQDFS